MQSRSGYRIGDGKMVDSMMFDGLTCTIEHCAMGEATERYAKELNLSRESQDIFAAQSHERASKAQKDGLFDDEITSVEIPARHGDQIIVREDEGIRSDVDAVSLGNLGPAFAADGHITAGNASQISDGAAAVVVTTLDHAHSLGIEPAGRNNFSWTSSWTRHKSAFSASNAIKEALRNTDLSISDLELFEINEAFAAVALASMRDLGVSEDIVNVNGGAIALGHPIGMSGTRVALTLALELKDAAEELGLPLYVVVEAKAKLWCLRSNV